MNTDIIVESLSAFHQNGINALIYSFSHNWCLILMVIAAVICAILGVTNESEAVVREEQNIL